MNKLSKDIFFTLSIKMLLLFLLWYFCFKGMHPHLATNKEWLLGKAQTNLLSHTKR